MQGQKRHLVGARIEEIRIGRERHRIEEARPILPARCGDGGEPLSGEVDRCVAEVRALRFHPRGGRCQLGRRIARRGVELRNIARTAGSCASGRCELVLNGMPERAKASHKAADWASVR